MIKDRDRQTGEGTGREQEGQQRQHPSPFRESLENTSQSGQESLQEVEDEEDAALEQQRKEALRERD